MTLLLAALLISAPAFAQEGRAIARFTRIHVSSYTLDVELVPATHHLRGKALVKFVPEEEALSISFELNNNLKPSKVVDSAGRQCSVDRISNDNAIRVNFDRPIPKGQPSTVTFEYDGALASGDNQPVEGLKLAYVGDPVSYLLYPGRWFPVSGYQVDRFTAELHITVPTGYRVVAPGRSLGAPKPYVEPVATPAPAPAGRGAARQPAATPPPATAASGNRMTFNFTADRASFPGSIAVMKEEAAHITSGGALVDVYFRDAEKAQSETYGEAAGKILAYFTTRFGPSPATSLSLVEIEAGSVNGYSAPGIIFLSPAGIGGKLNHRLLAHEIAHQWWRNVVSPEARSSLWLDEGVAAYGELLYTEELVGKAAAEELARDLAVSVMANDSTPISRSGSLEEFSPEYDAVVIKKGALVMHMLRWVIGDDPFFKTLREFPSQVATKPATTDQFRQAFERNSGQKLDGFFLQWTEATGAPEFKSEFQVFRTKKGFKIVGKIRQDLDTFRMPVEIRVETDGNPEVQKIDVVGTASDFSVDTFGRPRKVTIDPDNHVLKSSPSMKVKVAIARGLQFSEAGEYESALKEYQKALDLNKNSSLAHFRIGEVFFNQGNYQSAANAFRESLNGDRDPSWTEVWDHINLGKIYDVTGQRERAVNEYTMASRARDNTQGAQDEAQKYLKEPYRREKKD